MVDVFEEVEDQLRTEQYKRLALKALPWVLGVVIAAIVITAAWVGLHKYNENKAAGAAQAYQTAVESFARGDIDATYAEFDKVAKSAPRGYKALALMVQGGLRIQQNRTKDAVALFDAAAEAAPKGASGLLVADAARLKSALALLDDAPYADIEGRLKPLTEDDRPYRAMALEALALAKLNAGKIPEARADFESLSNSLDAPQTLIQRAKVGIALIDSGSASAVPLAVKAAKTAPPPALPQGLPPQGPATAPGAAVQ